MVELLAVIVILAIIMIISIPTVLDTMISARKRTFGEYVTKVYSVAQNKYMKDEMLGNSKSYVKYNIKNDLDLGSTGNYEGYVAISRNTNGLDIYVSLTDGEFKTATKYGEDESMVVNYINYTLGGEPTYTGKLEIYDGKRNYFINGTIDNFDLPDEPSEENGNTPVNIPISNNNYGNGGNIQTPEDKFEKETNEFLNLVKAKFNSDFANKDTSHMFATFPTSHEFGATTVDGNIYVYGYKINEFYPDTTNKGYIMFMRTVFDNTPLGFQVILQQNFISYMNETYHTILKVEGYSNSQGKMIVQTMPGTQQNEYYYTFNRLNFKKIDTLNTFDMTGEYIKALTYYKPYEYEKTGDNLNAFKSYVNSMNKFINDNQYYCLNSNPQCSLPTEYYDADYVKANLDLFDFELDFDHERLTEFYYSVQ